MDDQTFPRLLLIGATGPTGRDALEQAQRLDWRVRALARSPEALGAFAAAHEVVRGDVLSEASLIVALGGIDVVVCLLGTPFTMQPVTLLSEGTRRLVAAMARTGCRRLVCVTGMGAGDSRGHGGFLYDRVVLPLLLRGIYADKDRQEGIVRASGLDWTLVRPAMLTNDPPTGRIRALTDLSGARLTRIARKDVADFLLSEARAPKFSRQTVNLSQ